MNDRNVCSGFCYIDDNLKTCSAFIPKEDSTKRDIPFPDDSSTAKPVNISKSLMEMEKHNYDPTDQNTHHTIKVPIGKSVTLDNLLDRVEKLEEENENMKVLLSLIFAITNRFENKLFEPETWRVITEFAHKMGLQSIKFDMTDPVTYQIIDNK
jgi:hypothetical protein